MSAGPTAPEHPVVGDPDLYPFERQAVAGLALASLPDGDAIRSQLFAELGWMFPSLGESLDHLTTLTRLGARLGHRTVALRLLAKVASRRGMEPLQHEADRVRDFLHATSEQTDAEWALLHEHGQTVEAAALLPRGLAGSSPDSSIRDATPEVQSMLDGLEAAAQRQGPSWRSFAPKAAGPLRLSDEELGLPRCSDQEDVRIGGEHSTRIATWFSSPKPASAFADWTDPRTWPVHCSLYFESVTTDEEIPEGAQSWSARFVERVIVSEQKVLETPLQFTRTAVEDQLYALYFTMLPDGATEDLLVDTGALIAREDPCHPPGRTTQLFTEKCLRFAAPALRTWPTLLCDLYWMEFAMLAALGCRHE
jgi:hypothetical protein